MLCVTSLQPKTRRMLLLKASIKDHPGYVLYGNPPRWHLFNKDEHSDERKLHYHAKKTYHVAAVKKLMSEHNGASKSAADMRGEVEHLAGFMQGAASASAAVSMWKTAMLAGRAPKPAQQRAFESLAKTDPAKAARVLRDVATKLGDGDQKVGLKKMSDIHAGATKDAEVLMARKDTALRTAIAHLEQDAGQGDLPKKEKAEDTELVQQLRGALGDTPVGLEEIGREIDAARLPKGNVNAKSMNAMLDRLANLIGAGDPEAVQAQNWGTNTYARRVAKLAKRLAPAMGGIPRADLQEWAEARRPLAPLSRRTIPVHLINIEKHPALSNPDVRAGVHWMADSAGWIERGGRAMRNLEGEVVGRTSWVPREAWFLDKPDDLRDEHFKAAVAKMESGASLNLPERRALDYMIYYITAQDMVPDGQSVWDPEIQDWMTADTSAVVGLFEDDLEMTEVSVISDWDLASEEEREAELDRIFG